METPSADKSVEYRLGVGKAPITPAARGMGMLGYGLHHQNVEGVSTPIHARAFALEATATGRRLVFVSAELCFISQALRLGVLERLRLDHPTFGFDEDNVVLTATHTHSAPGGFSHYLFYNLNVPGFQEEVYDTAVDGIVGSIVQAVETMQPGRIRFAAVAIPEKEPVAFNRSPEAFKENPEAAPVKAAPARRQVDRRMRVLRFESKTGRPIGALGFFAVHCCSLHSDNNLIHPDNKGLAALAFEGYAQRVWDAPDFVAAIVQTAAGDVTPNFRFDRKRGFTVGVNDDDFESARFNGDIQFRYALEAFEAAAKRAPLHDRLLSRVEYADQSNVAIAPSFTGRPGETTAPAMLGIGFLMGTREGPGPLLRLGPAVRLLNRIAGRVRGPDHAHGPKFPFLEVARGGEGRCLGMFRQGRPLALGFLDPAVDYVRNLARHDEVGLDAWTPWYLPIQVVVIGDIAIAALPGEPTTMAGRRVSATLYETLQPLGVTAAMTLGYANAYAGYITTAEEYEVQAYEGASTHFGRWTLAGYQTRIAQLASEMAQRGVGQARAKADRTPYEDGWRAARPAVFDRDRLRRRARLMVGGAA